MWNNPSGGIHRCERADLSVSQNSLTTSPNKHSLPTPTPKADTTTPSPSASPASCSKSISTAPTATNKWLLATDQVRQVLQPIRRGGRLRAWSRVMRAELVERAKASGLYGQRWKVETVISVIKRKFGDGVRSRGLRLARREVLAKGVAYNLHRSFFVVVCVWCVR